MSPPFPQTTFISSLPLEEVPSMCCLSINHEGVHLLYICGGLLVCGPVREVGMVTVVPVSVTL